MKAEAKHAKKQFSSDENRRATYKKLHPSAFGHESSVLTTLSGNVKQLMKVCMYCEKVAMLLRVVLGSWNYFGIKVNNLYLAPAFKGLRLFRTNVINSASGPSGQPCAKYMT